MWGETARRFSFAVEIQSTSLELNVRGWTPGVEPCAETKSSRHCHLGRDARVFTPAGEFPFYVFPFPVLCLVSVAKRLPMSIPRGPLFGLSGRCIREQRDDFPTNLSSLSSFAFEKTSPETERIIRWKRASMRSLIVVLSAGRDQEKMDKAGSGKSKRGWGEKRYR